MVSLNSKEKTIKNKKQINLILSQYIKEETSLPSDIRHKLHGIHSGNIPGANVPSLPKGPLSTHYLCSGRQIQQLKQWHLTL